MENDENDVIRYLMDEMDPSQEVRMERAMMEDDDLLIEVESMRQTLNRLDNLPEEDPPEELTNSIIEQAAEQQERWYHVSIIPKQAFKYAAVLLLGIGLSSGFWLMQNDTSHISNISNVSTAEAPKTASAGSEVPASLQKVSTEKTEVEPWVDHNRILYLQDRFNANSTAFKGFIKASMKKVTPVNSPPDFNFSSRSLHLAGARQR